MKEHIEDAARKFTRISEERHLNLNASMKQRFGVAEGTSFIPLSQLKAISGYADRRSVKKWVAQFLGIALHRVGKNWCVISEEFERAITLRYAGAKEKIKTRRGYVPANDIEKKFLSGLEDLIQRNEEV